MAKIRKAIVDFHGEMVLLVLEGRCCLKKPSYLAAHSIPAIASSSAGATTTTASSSMFLMHDSDKDSTTKLEWKSSLDPFIFCQFKFQSKKTSESSPKLTAYEIFVTACHTSSEKPSSFILNLSSNNHSDSPNHNSPTSQVQLSLTSTAASKVKKNFDSKSPCSDSKKCPGSGSGQGKPKRLLTVRELMRNQIRVSEAMDSHVR
ncbi:hypothetical protein SESBI_47989 [Sesbania bispinosa]|nr:hypothetical protein SESBI_47989 [Sesbania bispinosa]